MADEIQLQPQPGKGSHVIERVQHDEQLVVAGPSNTNENSTGLLVPDPQMLWTGGVERHLLNKFLPQGAERPEFKGKNRNLVSVQEGLNNDGCQDKSK